MAPKKPKKDASKAAAGTQSPVPAWLTSPPAARGILDGTTQGGVGVANAACLHRMEQCDAAVAQARVSEAAVEGRLTLSLRGMQLTALPTLESVPWLMDLDCSHNRLHEDALLSNAALAHLRCLRRLDLSGNALGPRGSVLGHLPVGLIELNVEENFLHTIPDRASALPGLQWLSLRRNMLTQVPQLLEHWAQLQVLDLRDNGLLELPSSLACCGSLSQLLLSGNQLTEIPADCLRGCLALEVLHCAQNKLAALPASLAAGGCPWLRELNASGNAIAALPEDAFAGLPQLEVLILSGNLLSTLPTSMCRLAKLRTLLVGGNAISALPEGMGRLISLQELCCDGNANLGSLPPDLIGCTALAHATFRGTKIKTLPDEEAAAGAWVRLQLLDFRALLKGKKGVFKATQEFVDALPRGCRLLGAAVAKSKKKKAAAKA